MTPQDQTVQGILPEKKRDILFLQMRIKTTDDAIFLDRELCEHEAEEQLNWFKERGVRSYMTCGPNTLIGWFGEYYIDIAADDPIILEYSLIYEDAQGKSLSPNKYQMCGISYNNWLLNGGLERYEQHLKNRDDPNWEI